MSIYAVILERMLDSLYEAWSACDRNVVPTPHEYWYAMNSDDADRPMFAYYRRKWRFISIPMTNLIYFPDADTRQLMHSMNDDQQYVIRRYLRMLHRYGKIDCLVELVCSSMI